MVHAKAALCSSVPSEKALERPELLLCYRGNRIYETHFYFCMVLKGEAYVEHPLGHKLPPPQVELRVSSLT